MNESIYIDIIKRKITSVKQLIRYLFSLISSLLKLFLDLGIQHLSVNVWIDHEIKYSK